MKKLLFVMLAISGFATSSLSAGKFMCVNKKYFESNCIDDKDSEATNNQARCCIGKGLTTKDAECKRPGTYGCKVCSITGSNVTCSQCDRGDANDALFSAVIHPNDDFVCEYRSSYKTGIFNEKTRHRVHYVTSGSYDEGVREMAYNKNKKMWVPTGKRIRKYFIYTGEGNLETYNNSTAYSDRH